MNTIFRLFEYLTNLIKSTFNQSARRFVKLALNYKLFRFFGIHNFITLDSKKDNTGCPIKQPSNGALVIVKTDEFAPGMFT